LFVCGLIIASKWPGIAIHVNGKVLVPFRVTFANVKKNLEDERVFTGIADWLQ